MTFKSIMHGLFILLILQACATQKLKKEGKAAYQKGNYETALSAYEQIIEKKASAGNQAEAAIYYQAGMAAWKLGQAEKARGYLEKAEYMEYHTPGLYLTLAQINKKAENLYVKEMTAYKYHRTTSQYDRLLKVLDRVYATFKKSRNYFLILYKLDPKPDYAKYLGNIYTRLQEEDKAAYYYKNAE